MRSPADMDIVQVDGNVACGKKCSNCTRLVAHQTERWEMTPAQVKEAIDSMQGWNQPGRVLGLIGGEITLHSQFEEIATVFRENWNPHIKTKLHPMVENMEAFAQERLHDRTSGRGLWTSLGQGFYRNMESIWSTFDHWNTNAHVSDGLHQALLIHREDYQKKTGMSDSEWLANRDKCWVQNMWSATMNDKGAYFCEVAGSIDRLLYGGKSAWPIEKGWWKRKPADFTSQLHLCDHCALAQPGPANPDSIERDMISEKNRISLALVSPAVKKGAFDSYEKLGAGDRLVTTKDSYVDGPRVGEAADQLRPHKISCVVTCVGRAEHLRQTLAHNARLVDEIIVVTHEDDLATFEFAMDQDECRVVLSKCFAGDSAFNKGKAINHGLKAIQNPDWIILTDADVFLHPDTLDYIQDKTWNPGLIYGTRAEGMDAPIADAPTGFFQMFNRRAKAIAHRWPNVMSEEFPTAAGIDSWFTAQFPVEKRCIIVDIPVKHIPHGEFGKLWSPPRPQSWQFAGMLRAEGMHWINVPPSGKIRFKLTDCLYGQTCVIEMDDNDGLPEDVVQSNGRGGMVFMGNDIDTYHVSVCYWSE